MKLSKAQNPFDVQVGQKWKSKDKRRQNKFVVTGIEKYFGEGVLVAVAEYGKGKTAFHRYIQLTRFNEYTKVR